SGRLAGSAHYACLPALTAPVAGGSFPRGDRPLLVAQVSPAPPSVVGPLRGRVPAPCAATCPRAGHRPNPGEFIGVSVHIMGKNSPDGRPGPGCLCPCRVSGRHLSSSVGLRAVGSLPSGRPPVGLPLRIGRIVRRVRYCSCSTDPDNGQQSAPMEERISRPA